jgi:hypothetical protein
MGFAVYTGVSLSTLLTDGEAAAVIVAAVPVLTGGCARQGKKSWPRRYRGRHARRGRHACDGDARSQGVASVEVSTAPLPSWASPQSVAMAAWITVLLTLIGVILAAAAQEATSQAPAPVQIVIVPPSSTGLIPPPRRGRNPSRQAASPSGYLPGTDRLRAPPLSQPSITPAVLRPAARLRCSA